MRFFLGLFLLCAGTLMYEIVLTRLLSVISWYYLAFVSVSLAMLGMTAGALAVQLRPVWFADSDVSKRLVQATWGMALALPIALVNLLAIPLPTSISVRTAYSFLLFSAIAATPFLFAGVAVCLSLTRARFPIERSYFIDLLGAAAGCFGAILLLDSFDAPSAVLAISALIFVAAAAYAGHAGLAGWRTRSLLFALGAAVLAAANASTLNGLQPVWVKGKLDDRSRVLAEIWNPISKIRVFQPGLTTPMMWGPSARWVPEKTENIFVDIDNDAGTEVVKYSGDPRMLGYLRYDITTLGVQLRPGGSAAIIGVGGGRDVLGAASHGFKRIVGIEVNEAMLRLMDRIDAFAGLSRVPGLELHADEGRSFLTRSGESFDLIQASLVDTYAATSAGAMTLSENSLYTVDAWRIFWRHLKPGGIITFSRWNQGTTRYETPRMVALAWATLLAEGAARPEEHVALLTTPRVATLLLSNRPLVASDLARLRSIATEMDFQILLLPGSPPSAPDLAGIVATRSLAEMTRLRSGPYDVSPVYDDSPFFFSALRLGTLLEAGPGPRLEGNLLALSTLLSFLAAAVLLIVPTVFVPLRTRSLRGIGNSFALGQGAGYFLLVGAAFMLVEIAMMQQLSIFLGNPIYSLTTVLAGLIASTGLGSVASERWRGRIGARLRVPVVAAAVAVGIYSAAVLPAIGQFATLVLWQRVLLTLALIAPCGFLMGFCFPLGMRRMRELGLDAALPWMWALNGGASVVAAFVAILLSMETSITACVRTGALLYVAAAFCMPRLQRSA
ncbi:MAG TPA: class I SAM-dependent methyltransferase [Burkholderiales bacterium]|nr:class I SAM-dependent methyltransferase [Burkholderiales bacterium]